jgi:hypothetical protein
MLYVDERARPEQRSALTDIFKRIGEVYAVKPARIDLDHTPGRERLYVGESVWPDTARTFDVKETVTCGIPVHARTACPDAGREDGSPRTSQRDPSSAATRRCCARRSVGDGIRSGPRRQRSQQQGAGESRHRDIPMACPPTASLNWAVSV